MKKPDKHRIAQRLTRGAAARKGGEPPRAVEAKRWRKAQMRNPNGYIGFGAAMAGLNRTLERRSRLRDLGYDE